MLIETALSEKGNRSWKVVTAPVVEPITVEEVRLFCRIDTEDEDSLIIDFIKGVRENAELFLGRALINQTIRMVMDYWPGIEVELPQPPLSSITSIETIDEDDTATTYSSSNYFAVTESIPGKVVIKRGSTSPINTERDSAGYRITYVAGYGAKSTDVPQAIREGLKMWVASAYENRIISVNPPPESKQILNLYKVVKI